MTKITIISVSILFLANACANKQNYAITTPAASPTLTSSTSPSPQPPIGTSSQSISTNTVSNTKQNDFNMALECNNLGQKYFQQLQTNNLVPGDNYISPQYHFNKNLNSCLIDYQIISQYFTSEHLDDVLSNKNIIFSTTNSSLSSYPNEKFGLPISEYIVQRDALMSQ